jgi:SAM-dependent methyltransferase
MDQIAAQRSGMIRKNSYYYKRLINFLRYNIPEGKSVIEIGCGNGHFLKHLKPSRGVGIDFSPEMIRTAKEENPGYEYQVMDAENLTIDEKFDFIILSDTIGYLEDVQKAFENLRKISHPETRVIITYINFLWMPVLKAAEFFGLKMKASRNNWMNIKDISNLLEISGFEEIRSGKMTLLPVGIPLISDLVNKYIGNLPLMNNLCLMSFIISKPVSVPSEKMSVSVVVPARNEKGNIAQIVRRVPVMGRETEIVFVEGNSSDNTQEEIEKVCSEYEGPLILRSFVQEGKGKADAVRKGFSECRGDILMILDADMTVPPEDLPKFYECIVNGRGEFLNGSRLIYPLEKDAMRTLNILGNKFFSMMFSWILRQDIKDTLCGTKVFTRSDYEKIKSAKSFLGDFDPFGDFDLIFGAAKVNLKFREIPIRYKARVYGETNISRFRHGWMLLKMTFYAMNKFKFV